jgi:hypothetical protein
VVIRSTDRTGAGMVTRSTFIRSTDRTGAARARFAGETAFLRQSRAQRGEISVDLIDISSTDQVAGVVVDLADESIASACRGLGRRAPHALSSGPGKSGHRSLVDIAAVDVATLQAGTNRYRLRYGR